MIFADIPSGDSVFVDANVFIYNFAPDPQYGPPCRELLERIELGDLIGFCSAREFSDVAHRLMTLEACQTWGWPYAGIGHRLRTHRDEITRLTLFRQALDEIVAFGVHVLPVTQTDVLRAGDLSRQHGLLSGDTLIVALMQSNNLTSLASNDTDFDRIPGLYRYGPASPAPSAL